MSKVVPITGRGVDIGGHSRLGRLMPPEEAEQYEAHVRGYFADYEPVEGREQELTRDLAETSWRLNRLDSIEENVRRLEGSGTEAGEAFTRALPTIKTQRTRLRRRYKMDLKELTELQARRDKGPRPGSPGRLIYIRD